MAVEKRILFEALSGTDRVPVQRYITKTVNRLFAAVSGAPLLPINLPVAYDSALDVWKRWDVDGAAGEGDQIRGFLTCALQTHATNTVPAEIAFKGEFDREDINNSTIRAALPNTPSEGELDEALRDPELRAIELNVRGVEQV
jgi:hypothetical protein